jgi:maltose/maltodextrin transport system permease protein
MRLRALGWAVAGASALAVLWTVYALHLAGRPLWALGVLVFGALALHVYTTSSSLAWRYLFPGVAGMLLFVAFPLVYTVQIGFTNYSSAHLLERERARAYLLEQFEVDASTVRPFTLHAQGDAVRLVLGAPPAAAPAGEVLLSPPLRLPAAGTLAAEPLRMQAGPAPDTPALSLREVIQRRDALQGLRLALPDGTVLAYAGLRDYACGRTTPTARSRSAPAAPSTAPTSRRATSRPNRVSACCRASRSGWAGPTTRACCSMRISAARSWRSSCGRWPLPA